MQSVLNSNSVAQATNVIGVHANFLADVTSLMCLSDIYVFTRLGKTQMGHMIWDGTYFAGNTDNNSHQVPQQQSASDFLS